jgi:hypothetical protein
VSNNSDDFNADCITAFSHASDGIRIDTNAAYTATITSCLQQCWQRLLHRQAGAGFPAAWLRQSARQHLNNGAVALFSDSVAHDNLQTGIVLANPGAAPRSSQHPAYRRHERREQRWRCAALLGNPDLGLARGNLVYANRDLGIAGHNLRVVGNTVRNQTGQFAEGISLIGASEAQCGVRRWQDRRGEQSDRGHVISGNNTGAGITGYSYGGFNQNVVY